MPPQDAWLKPQDTFRVADGILEGSALLVLMSFWHHCAEIWFLMAKELGVKQLLVPRKKRYGYIERLKIQLI